MVKRLEEIIFSFLEVKPEQYSKKEYQIISKDYGLYPKKEATIICNFLRSQMGTILMDKIKKGKYASN